MEGVLTYYSSPCLSAIGCHVRTGFSCVFSKFPKGSQTFAKVLQVSGWGGCQHPKRRAAPLVHDIHFRKSAGGRPQSLRNISPSVENPIPPQPLPLYPRVTREFGIKFCVRDVKNSYLRYAWVWGELECEQAIVSCNWDLRILIGNHQNSQSFSLWVRNLGWFHWLNIVGWSVPWGWGISIHRRSFVEFDVLLQIEILCYWGKGAQSQWRPASGDSQWRQFKLW